MQAVKHTGLKLMAANVFSAGWHEAAGLSIDGPASVIARAEPGDKVTLAASDPTMDRETVTVLIRGQRLTTVEADEGVRVRHVAAGTLVEYDTHQAYVRSFTATLR